MTLLERQKISERQEIEALTQQLIKIKQRFEALSRLSEERERELTRLREIEYLHKGSLKQQHKEWREEQEALLEQQQKLVKALADAQAALNQKDQELQAIRTQAAEQQRESWERLQTLETAAHVDKQERMVLIEKISALDQTIILAQRDRELLNENYTSVINQKNQLKESLEIARAEMAILHKQSEELQQELALKNTSLEKLAQAQVEQELTARQSNEQALHRNQKIESLSGQIGALEKEKLKLEESLARMRRTLEERDSELKAAQHHLAKKVKESARLAEIQEETEQRAARLQKDLGDHRTALEEIKGDLTRLQQRETQLQEQLNEQMQSAEAKMAKWETEYFKVVEQWKEGEVKTRRLRQLEEKMQQLRANFVELDHLFAPPSPVPEPSPAREPLQVKEPPVPLASADLFTLPKPPPTAGRVKQHLFDKSP